MPIVSKAQQRWAYANAGKNTREGKAAADFVAAGPKGGSFKKLPATKGGYADERSSKSNRPGGNSHMTRRFGSL